MQILYKSDVTGKTYKSEEALLEAEAKVSEAKKQEELEKKARAEMFAKLIKWIDNELEWKMDKEVDVEAHYERNR